MNFNETDNYQQEKSFPPSKSTSEIGLMIEAALQVEPEKEDFIPGIQKTRNAALKLSQTIASLIQH